MPDGVEVRIRGLEQFASGARTLAGNIDRSSRREFGRQAQTYAERVRGAVPRNTGALAGSVDGRPTSDGGRVEMGAGVTYARYVEFGGRGFPHSAQGNYFGPVVKDADRELGQVGERVAADEVRRMRWPTP